jgi:hypothetical protein
MQAAIITKITNNIELYSLFSVSIETKLNAIFVRRKVFGLEFVLHAYACNVLVNVT